MTATKYVELIWFDPGVTTGVCYMRIDPKWLSGKGLTTWEAMGAYVKSVKHWQIGRHARRWDAEHNCAVAPEFAPEFLTKKFNGQLPSLMLQEISQVMLMQEVLDDHPNAAWGYEDFVLRGFNQSREFLSPMRLFSMLTYSELSSAGARAPFVQSASMAKTSATDARLSAASLYRPGMPHACDAARHAATFIRRARSDEGLRQTAWPELFLDPLFARN